MNNKDFGSFIAELRKEQGITQKELADQVGVSDKAVSRWETGKNYPDVEIMQNLSDALGISISELMQGERLDQSEIIKVSNKNIIKSFKKNKKNKIIFTVIISIILIALITVSALLIKNNNSQIIEKNLTLYSADTRALLDNIDSFIYQQNIGADDFTLNNCRIMMNAQKEASDLYIAGATGDNVGYYCGALCENGSPSYTFVNQYIEPIEWEYGITCNELIDFLNIIDFKDFDTEYSIANTYNISIDGGYEESDYIYKADEYCPTYFYTADSKTFTKVKDNEHIKDECVLINLVKYYEGEGESIALIFYRTHEPSYYE